MLAFVLAGAGAAVASGGPAGAIGSSGPVAATSETGNGSGGSLCAAGERVQFSCSVGQRTVSLCAGGSAQSESLTYRFGRPGRIELAHEATAANGQRFQATVMPASPRALVRQVWFDLGSTRYLLSQCVGGDCPYAAGLAVLKDGELAMSRRCEPSATGRNAHFDAGLVRFGADVTHSQSGTPLLTIDEVDNRPDLLYPTRGGRP